MVTLNDLLIAELVFSNKPELPELVVVWTKGCMSPGVCVTSAVTEPDIKAGISHEESKTLIGQVLYPARGTGQKWMPQ